jgi:DNA polymerase I-like protein with 3'-5' exonuclease and polymerase domains
VAIPGADHEAFGYDSDVSHGARVWGNLLGLVATNTWLEQRHRKVVQLAGKKAILAEPIDYKLVYDLFETVAGRSVINVSEIQEKILDAVWALNEEHSPNQRGWEQRQVAEKAGISQSTVSRNYKELQVELSLLDPEAGTRLRLATGVTQKSWNREDIMSGFPTPEDYEEIWEEIQGDDGPDGPDGGGGASSPPPPPPFGGGEEHPSELVHTAHILHEESGNGHNPDKNAELQKSGRAYEKPRYAQSDAPPLSVHKSENDMHEVSETPIAVLPIDKPDEGEENKTVQYMRDMHEFRGVLITTDEAVRDLVNTLRGVPRVALDLEGDLRIPTGKEGVRGMAVAADGVEAFVDFYAVDPETVLRALEGEDKELLVHGAEYDLPPLIKFYGFDPKGRILDTMNMSRAAYPGAYRMVGEYAFERVSHTLVDCIERDLDLEVPHAEDKGKYQKIGAWVPTPKRGGEMGAVPEITEEMVEYALGDVRYLSDLYEKLLEQLEKIGQLETYQKTEMPIGQVLPRLMARGIPIDLAAWSGGIEGLEREAQKLYKGALELAPPHPRKGERVKPNSKKDLSTWDWNFGSYNPNTKQENRQDALLCLELYGLGDYFDNARDATLEAYLDHYGEDPLVQSILAYRQTKNLVSRMRNFVKDATHEGRIYTQLHSYGTETGRITTTDTNLNGLDKQGEWRNYLRDHKGKSRILRADLDQIELRILACVVADATGDDSLLRVYRDPLPDGTFEDLHTATARIATGRDDLSKDSPERKKAKATNFSIAYGARKNEDNAAFFEAFFERFPGVEEWQRDYGSRDDFWTESIRGRKRFVDPYLGGYKAGFPNREQRLNGPIQTTGADILKTTILKLWATEPPFARALFPAHDEVVIELLDPDKEEKAISWVTGEMTEAVVEVLGEDLAKNVVDAKMARSWGEAS